VTIHNPSSTSVSYSIELINQYGKQHKRHTFDDEHAFEISTVRIQSCSFIDKYMLYHEFVRLMWNKTESMQYFRCWRVHRTTRVLSLREKRRQNINTLNSLSRRSNKSTYPMAYIDLLLHPMAMLHTRFPIDQGYRSNMKSILLCGMSLSCVSNGLCDRIFLLEII
jgi:hypothetical protein